MRAENDSDLQEKPVPNKRVPKKKKFSSSSNDSDTEEDVVKTPPIRTYTKSVLVLPKSLKQKSQKSDNHTQSNNLLAKPAEKQIIEHNEHSLSPSPVADCSYDRELHQGSKHKSNAMAIMRGTYTM